VLWVAGVSGLWGAVIAYFVVLTLIVLKVLDLTIGLRVNIEDEKEWLDVTSHGEAGYNI
jgi:Amt family ammonium transporter